MRSVTLTLWTDRWHQLRRSGAILRRFGMAAWEASRAGVVAQSLLVLLQGFEPAGVLWLSRGLVDLLSAMLTGRVAARLLPALPWIGGLWLLSLLGAAADTSQRTVAGWLQQWVALRQKQRFLAAAAAIDLARLEQPETQDLMQRARSAFGHRLPNLLLLLTSTAQLAVTLIGYLALLASKSGIIAFLVLLPAVPSLWLKARVAQTSYYREYDATPSRRMMAYLFELLVARGPGQEVRLFGLFPELWRRWRAAQSRACRESMTGAWFSTRASIATGAVEAAAFAGAIAVLATLIARGRLTVGDYVVITGAAVAFQADLEALVWKAGELLRDLTVLQDLQQFLGMGEQARRAAGTAAFPSPLREGLVVRELAFRYPGTDRDVVAGVSFSMRPGEVVALVGVNGAGKSTLIKLLLGLYRPCAGTVRYDGVDIQQIAPAQIAASCAAVFQELARFRRPMREELAPGDPALQRDDGRLRSALAAVGLPTRLWAAEHGLDRFLDPSLGGPEGGIELSGGEWQKIALARALVRDAQLLVLDEPTAALDPEAEVEVYRQFASLARGRMTLLISHRLGSARLADRILVMEAGRIVEEGRHEELLARAGVYARLFEAQAQWYRAG